MPTPQTVTSMTTLLFSALSQLAYRGADAELHAVGLLEGCTAVWQPV